MRMGGFFPNYVKERKKGQMNNIQGKNKNPV